jgi:hypothetical protein
VAVEIKIYGLFCGENAGTFVRRQIKFGALKIMEIYTGFISLIILVDGDFKYGDVRSFELILGQTPNHCVCYSVILCKLFNLLLNDVSVGGLVLSRTF